MNLLRQQSYYYNQPYPNQPYRNPAPAPEPYAFHGSESQPNAFHDFSSQPSAFPFSHLNYVSQTQMGGLSSQRRTDPPMSLIHAFPIEDMYTPEFSDSFQENTGSFQEPTREESPVEVATSPLKTKIPIRGRKKRTIQSDDAPRQIAWTHDEEIALCKVHGEQNKIVRSSNVRYGEREMEDGAPGRESGEASINLNANVGDDEEDEVQEIRRPMGRDKAKDATKKKGSRASGSSSMNDEALARLMVTKIASQTKEERLAFLEIKRREVECREREVRIQEYRQRQDDIRFYLQPYDHLTRDARLAMEELRAEIKAKYDLPY
ncbi:hypothetical protein Tco_0405083 [Tanacetum coccineum]